MTHIVIHHMNPSALAIITLNLSASCDVGDAFILYEASSISVVVFHHSHESIVYDTL